jgi:agmatinase
MCSFPIGQGHGIENRYGGLPDEYSIQEKSAIVILPVPFEMTTTYQKGTQNGPAALIEASRNMELYDIETNSSVYKKGIYTAPPLLAFSSENMRQRLYTQIIDFISQGKFVVTLGGEHSISYAPIQAYAEKFPGMSVLQIDAHADLQEAYEGNPWSHASIMARVREIPLISSIVSVGIRSMSQEESLRVDASRTFFAHQLNFSGDWIEKIEQQLSDTVYITFDLDGFDSSLMPSTGTPEPGGLEWNQTMALLRHIILKKRVVGLDVVELCPSPQTVAPDYLAAKLIYKILSYHFFYHS